MRTTQSRPPTEPEPLRSPDQTRTPRRHRRRVRRTEAFTLIELLVVIAILGIIANILIPTLMLQLQKAQAQRIITDFHFFRQNLFEYHTDTGVFPRDRGFGVAPPEMNSYLEGRMRWNQSQAGIWYDWENWVRNNGKPRRPNTGVARGFSVRLDTNKHRMKTLIPMLYPEANLVIRGRKVIFVIEPAG